MSGGDGLFEIDTAATVRPQSGPRPAVDKRFRAFEPDQMLLMPPSLEDWLPQDHLARFVADLVDEVLDLSSIRAAYTEKRGYPPYDPRLMARLLIYGYTTGALVAISVDPEIGEPIPGDTTHPELRQYTDENERVRVLYFVTALRTIIIWGSSVVVAGQEPATV